MVNFHSQKQLIEAIKFAIIPVFDGKYERLHFEHYEHARLHPKLDSPIAAAIAGSGRS